MTKKEEEVKLFENMAMGSREAMTTIYERWKDFAYRVAFELLENHQDAEDIRQEVFAKIWVDRVKRKILHPTTYISKMAYNTALDLIKKRKPERAYYKKPGGEQETLQLPNELDKNTTHEQPLPHEMLKQAIDQMSPQQGRIFKEIKINGKKRKEVAEQEGLSITTVDTHLSRAYELIREMFNKKP